MYRNSFLPFIRLHVPKMLRHVTLYCYIVSFATLFVGRGFVPALAFVLLMDCAIVLYVKGNCAYSRDGVLSVVSERLFNRTRLCRGDPVSPRKFMDALSTVTRAYVNFSYKG